LSRALVATGSAWLWLALACASPTGVRTVAARDVHRTLTSNVLSSGSPSVPSWHVLQRAGLREVFDDDPTAAITALSAVIAAAGSFSNNSCRPVR